MRSGLLGVSCLFASKLKMQKTNIRAHLPILPLREKFPGSLVLGERKGVIVGVASGEEVFFM